MEVNAWFERLGSQMASYSDKPKEETPWCIEGDWLWFEEMRCKDDVVSKLLQY